MNAGKTAVMVLGSLMMLSSGVSMGDRPTPEDRCEKAKLNATLEWQQCRSKLSNQESFGKLAGESLWSARQKCDDKHTQAFNKINQNTLDGELRDCNGHPEVVRNNILGSGLAFLGGGASIANVGVNIFGMDGFEDQKTMIATLFNQGIRKFRVINVGGWPTPAYEAINAEAGKLSASERAKVSVYVPSQYFQGQFDVKATKAAFASWSNIPHWMIQLDACNPFATPGSEFYCSNPTEAGLSKTNMPEYLAQIKVAIPQFANQAYTVEFVIPFQNSTVSPDDKLTQVHAATVEAFPQFQFRLEQTEYPFWVGSTDTNFPFGAADSFDSKAKDKGFAGGTFAESGWPRSCPQKPATATLTNQCAYLKSLLHGTPGDSHFVTYWWVLGAENVGDGCGPDSWGVFLDNTTLACPGSF